MQRLLVKVLKKEKGQSQEVVTVKVADEDGVDVGWGNTQALQVREKSGGRVEQVAAVEQKRAPVAPTGSESVA